MRDLPWILGTLGAIGFFTLFETLALKWPLRFDTLSTAIYTLGARWPLSIYLMGMFSGGLAVHFFWHWCPAGSISEGLLQLLPLLHQG